MAGNEAAFRESLAREAARWSIPCEAAQHDALARYATLLLTWTARINLTGAVSLEELATEHLPDSFALASRLSDAGPASAVDVGSGGGLPAIPLAVLSPNLSIQLLEPIAKKAAFLRTAIRELGLAGRVRVDTRRAQALVPATFDVALSRATLPPRAWLSVAVDLVRPGGRVFVLASAASGLALGPQLGTPLPAPSEAAVEGDVGVAGLTVTGRWDYLAGRRWLLELVKPHS